MSALAGAEDSVSWLILGHIACDNWLVFSTGFSRRSHTAAKTLFSGLLA